jgi:hypothetical protein
MEKDEELAHELLLSARELAARAALARELRKEAPGGFYTGVLACLIDPPRSGVTQRIEFKRLKGAPRLSERADLDIVLFMRAQLEKDPKIDAAVKAAETHFDLKERRVRKAWSRYRP